MSNCNGKATPQRFVLYYGVFASWAAFYTQWKRWAEAHPKEPGQSWPGVCKDCDK